MSLEIKTQQPISIILPFGNATLANMQSIIPGITEIVGEYIDTTGEFGGAHIYRVLAPYSFTPPTTVAFGDQMMVAYFVPSHINPNGKDVNEYYQDTPSAQIPSTLLAQDTVCIYFYEK